MNLDLNVLSAAAEHPVISGLLAGLLLLFLGGFVVRGLVLQVQLGRALARLRALPTTGRGLEPQAVGQSLGEGGWLGHLWNEHRKTLYRAGDEASPEARWLATVPAESVWNGPAVVDPRVGAEFFKHLPGIFTGLGIIGTFFGLVRGLQQFRVSADAQEVRVSLEALMGAVGGAFAVSMVAIGLAIAVTLVEKLLLGALHGRTERIALELDRRFAAEPAERFLEAGARHAFTSAQRLGALPGELVAVLQPQLQALSEQHARTLVRLTGTLQTSLAQAGDRQLASAEQQAARLEQSFRQAMGQAMEVGIGPAVGQAVGQAVSEAMTGPVSRSLGEAVGQAVADTVSRGLADALQRSLAEPLDRIAQAVQETGRTQGEATPRELGEALDRFGMRLDSLLGTLPQTLGATLGQVMADATTRLDAREDGLQQRADAWIDEHHERSSEQIGRLVTAVEALLRQSALTDDRLQQTVAALSATSRSAIGGLGEGAQQVQAATRQFAAAAEKAGTAMAQVADWGTRLDATGRLMADTTAQLQQGVVDYQSHREQVGRMVGELQTLLSQARREASLSADVLQRIEAAGRELGRTQLQAEAFMGGVADVLAQAHEAFSQAMLRTVGQQNEAFQQQLGSAVARLSTTVEQLDDALGAVVPPVRNP